MSSDFMIINRKILPDYLDKVIEARNLLESKEAATITEAVQMAGISRNTYYKYKDYVFSVDSKETTRHAVISMILRDQPGALANVMGKLTDLHTSILTISQAIPIAGKANVLISLDISGISCSVSEMMDQLKHLNGVRSVHLDAVE